MQLSITHSTIIAQGLSSNMAGQDDSISRDGGGLVDHARINKITLQAWSPFQKGFQDGVFFDAPDYVIDAAHGSDIPLTRSEWYGLIQAAGHNVP